MSFHISDCEFFIFSLIEFLDINDIAIFSTTTKKIYSAIRKINIIKKITLDGYWYINNSKFIINNHIFFKILDSFKLNGITHIFILNFIPWNCFSKLGHYLTNIKKNVKIKIIFDKDCSSVYIHEVPKFINYFKNSNNFNIELINFPSYFRVKTLT